MDTMLDTPDPSVPGTMEPLCFWCSGVHPEWGSDCPVLILSTRAERMAMEARGELPARRRRSSSPSVATQVEWWLWDLGHDAGDPPPPF